MKHVEIKLKKSIIGRSPPQKEALRCLGLRKINQIKKHPHTAATWGQIKKILHMVECDPSEAVVSKKQTTPPKKLADQRVKPVKSKQSKESAKKQSKTTGKGN